MGACMLHSVHGVLHATCRGMLAVGGLTQHWCLNFVVIHECGTDMAAVQSALTRQSQGRTTSLPAPCPAHPYACTPSQIFWCF